MNLCAKRDSDGPLPPATRLRVAAAEIRSKLEEVMYCYNRLSRAAGYPPLFDLHFHLSEAPRLVQWEVAEFLKKRSGYQAT